MTELEFWPKRKHEFRELAELEYAVVPDPADSRRLYAYGDYSRKQSSRFGSWTLNESFSLDFHASFEEAAALAGHALNPPADVTAIHFWLHSLFQFLLEVDRTSVDRGHLAVGDRERGGIIRDVSAASAMFCSYLAAKAMDRRSRYKEAGAIELVRISARQMIAEGATHQQVCQRLRDQARPPRAEWRHLTWDKAYLNSKFRGSVRKWLSKNCRP